MLTDTQSRALARRIVTDNGAARVKFGRTNGEIVLHVFVDGAGRGTRSSFTIKSLSEWEACPLNERIKRNEREAAAQPVEAMMASNGSKR